MLNKIRSLWARLNKFENLDPDSARRGRLINVLLTGMAGLSLVALVISLGILSITAAWEDPGNALLLLTLVVFTLAGLGLLALNQYSVKYTSFLFLAVLTVMLTFSDTPHEVANGRSSYVFFIPIAISSLLLAPASSFIFATISGIIIILLSVTPHEVPGMVKMIQEVPNVATIISGFLLALVSWLSSRSLEQALKDLRVINLNLDKLVEQKTQELAATLSRELVLAGRNQAILESIADGVIVFDANHVSILANPALSHIAGISLENLIGINITDFAKSRDLSPASQGMIMGVIEHPKTTEESFRVEWGRRTLSLSVARVQNTTTNANIGTVAVFRDITNEAVLEKMKSTFVAIISHELRTPLNAIMGYAEMLKETVYGPVNAEQSSALERVVVNTGRMLTMVGDLLDEAQLKAGKLSIKNQPFKTASLLKTMHTTMDKITADKGLHLTDELDPDMPETITGDAQRLQQVIINLVNNSAKFTEEGGIHISIMRSEPDHWMIKIKDTGIGIPEKEIPYIFDTFRQVEQTTTRKHGGFGLGLAIVKQLVELMKGKISVQSEIGIGSVFTVILPLQ